METILKSLGEVFSVLALVSVLKQSEDEQLEVWSPCDWRLMPKGKLYIVHGTCHNSLFKSAAKLRRKILREKFIREKNMLH